MWLKTKKERKKEKDNNEEKEIYIQFIAKFKSLWWFYSVEASFV